MAAEAEAAREARAKIIRAHGEEKATQALKQAADELAHNPNAIQLRYLQVIDIFVTTALSSQHCRRAPMSHAISLSDFSILCRL